MEKIVRANISDIVLNKDNPRIIRDEKFFKLVQSIKDFPEMLNLRPIVVNDEMVVLGGNMRLKACREAGLTQVPIIRAAQLTEEQQREFIIKDNVSFGDWDFNVLHSEWDAEALSDWGVNVPKFDTEELGMPTEEELAGEMKNKAATMKLTFKSPEQLQEAEVEIQQMISRSYPGAFYSISAGEI